MWDFMEYDGEERPDWDEEQFAWMGVCEYITRYWYLMLSMDEYARLYQIKYPEVDKKTIRDAYVFQFYSEMDFRGEEAFDVLENRDTLLTPIVDENTGTEYLMCNEVEDEEELFEKVLSVHGDKEMYLPTEHEMYEYMYYGFNPSDPDILEALVGIADLVSVANPVNKSELLWNEDGKPVDQDGKIRKDVDEEVTYRDRMAQAAVCNAIRGFEHGVPFENVMEKIFDAFLFTDPQKVLEQFLTIFNNTHLPGNKGYTPLQMQEKYGKPKEE